VTVDDQQWLTEHFQAHRPHLRAVAYRMLGSLADADDAVQDAWERVSRARADEVGNLKAWLTTIVARVCLNLLRSRTAQREESLEVRVPDPILTWRRARSRTAAAGGRGVGLALQVVIDTPAPAEGLTFVLHDLFDLPCEEIAPLVGRTPEATRQLASRARRRVKAAETPRQR
jgi:RNA polymerase sigma factor (sigma-70 family)